MWRRVAGTSALVALMSFVVVGADAVGAAGHSTAGVSAPSARAPVTAAHPAIDEPNPVQFEIMEQIAGESLAMTAPATNEVWVVLDVEGDLRLGHYKDWMWSTTVLLPGHGGAPTVGPRGDRRAVLESSGPDDVWLAAGGRLSHYDGSRWKAVPLPRDPEGAGLFATTVAAQAPGRAYVGVTGGERGEHGAVYRYVGGAWTRLGAPNPRWPYASMTPRDIKPVRGVVMVHWTQQTDEDAFHTWWNDTFWWHDGRRWLFLYDGPQSEWRYWKQPTAWILRDDWRHLVLGAEGGKALPTTGTCMTWDAPGPVRGCTTGSSVSSAGLRRDGSVVVASDGYSGWVEGRPTAAALYLRHPSGREVRIGQTSESFHSSGNLRSVVAVAPDGMTTWAATPLGLQRLAGRRSG